MDTKIVYQELARHLDSFPQGYPSTLSGVELELLAALFTQEEARLAYFISNWFTALTDLVELTGWSKSKLRGLVKSMAKKGLVKVTQKEGEIEVLLLPFIVGFYENQRENLDEVLAQLVEDYFQETNFDLVSIQPYFHRVIPVREAINTKIEILPEDDIAMLLSSKSAWAVIDCICRHQQAMLGQACGHPIHTCLVMSEIPQAFDQQEGMDALTLTEALDVLRTAADAGLVHTVANHRTGLSYVCNCCTCGCGILRGIAETHLANVVARSPYMAVVDEQACIACGNCEVGCQFSAIEIGDTADIDSNTCVGCGICAHNCPEGAIVLTLRPLEDILAIPDGYHDWLEARRVSRNLADE